MINDSGIQCAPDFDVSRAEIPLHRYDVASEAAYTTPLKRSGPRVESVTPYISLQEATEDLYEYQRQLEQRFAYLKASNVDYRLALERVRSSFTGLIAVTTFKNELAKITAMFIDGHAGPKADLRSETVMPFSIVETGGRYVALAGDKKSFLDPDYPYISHIDGWSIDRWTAVVDPFVVAGSPQTIRQRTLWQLKYLPTIRTLAGRTQSELIQVRLVSSDGSTVTEKRLRLVGELPATESDSERGSQLLKDGIAYLRIPLMNDAAVLEIREWMPAFKNAKGLVVDVRGNGGGSRKALLELMPYFMDIGETHIGNIAAHRLYDEFSEVHLSDGRFVYRESDSRWNDREQRVIQEFISTFVPEWDIPTDEFSDWHYLMLSKREGDTRYSLNKPVIVLIDDGCFSATDIFVSALKGWKNVTLMGRATGGGSARSITEKLPNSGIKVRLASMVSFQSDGQLFDGRGVQPDISVQPSPQSFLIGGRDNVLDDAIILINKIADADTQ